MKNHREELIEFIESIKTRENPLSLQEFSSNHNISLEGVSFIVEFLKIFNVIEVENQDRIYATNETALFFLKSLKMTFPLM